MRERERKRYRYDSKKAPRVESNGRLFWFELVGWGVNHGCGRLKHSSIRMNRKSFLKGIKQWCLVFAPGFYLGKILLANQCFDTPANLLTRPPGVIAMEIWPGLQSMPVYFRLIFQSRFATRDSIPRIRFRILDLILKRWIHLWICDHVTHGNPTGWIASEALLDW